jgi:hypothetical protein
MSSRKSIYLADASEKVIGHPGSLSGRINSIVIRYGNIVAATCPTLSRGEWLLICDMLNGTVLDTDSRDADPSRYLWADISESGKFDGLAEKWNVDTADLSTRVRAMTPAEQIAILEVVGHFWRNPQLAELNHDQLLAAAGAKIEA